MDGILVKFREYAPICCQEHRALIGRDNAMIKDHRGSIGDRRIIS